MSVVSSYFIFYVNILTSQVACGRNGIEPVAVAFNGSAIKFMGAYGWDHGSFLVTLDDEEVTGDGYCCGPDGGVPQAIQFTASALAPGVHVLNITNSSAGPYGSVLEVDAIIIPQHAPNYRYLALLALLILLVPIFAALHRRRQRVAKGTPRNVLPISSPLVDDNLVEQIAQRAVSLLRADAPPTYEKDATTGT
ncbi:hypothetical protein C8R45DRAFT_941017 [Mycena sanguinolenta]|nr:hypothetical protein C8R45DRAFT_941017 [Mycena sanguinolenta]